MTSEDSPDFNIFWSTGINFPEILPHFANFEGFQPLEILKLRLGRNEKIGVAWIFVLKNVFEGENN